jgi:hypothetical protein
MGVQCVEDSHHCRRGVASHRNCWHRNQKRKTRSDLMYKLFYHNLGSGSVSMDLVYCFASVYFDTEYSWCIHDTEYSWCILL